MVATTGEVPVFIVIKESMSPVPESRSPIPGLSLVQAYVVVPPVLVVPKITDVVLAVLQTTWLPGWITSPVGLTVMVKDCEGPVQSTPPLVNIGVTMIVATTGAVPVLTVVNESMSPVPEAAKPIEGVSLVQTCVEVPPEVTVVNSTDAEEPLQTTWSAGLFTCAVGFTVMVKVLREPSQLTPALVKVGITVIIASTGEVPVFTAVNEAMFPLPVAARPIPGVSFVQA